MKKILSRSAALLLTLVVSATLVLLYTACKKYDNPGGDSNLPLLQAAQNWYQTDVIENEIKNSNDTLPLTKGVVRKPGRMKQIGGLLKWQEAREYTYNGINFLVTPLNENSKPFANTAYEAGRCLIFYRDAASKMQMHVMEMVGQKGLPINGTLQDIARASFSNYADGKNVSLGKANASILFYNKEYKYEKGFVIAGNAAGNKLMRLQEVKQGSKRPVLSTVSQRVTEEDWCTVYYLVGYHYDPVTGQIADSEILAVRTECPNGETPPPYGGSGGSSSPPPPDDECAIGALNAINEISNNATVVNNTVSITTESEGMQMRTKKYQWVILQGIGWNITSFETGVHIKTRNTNPNLTWVWQSLTNNGISLSGWVAGGHIEPKLMQAIPSVGKYNAIMDLTFNVEYSVACKGSPFSRDKGYNSAKNFSVND